MNEIVSAVQPSPQSNEKKSSTFSCSYCGQTFGKLEHAHRHERSHTKEKPFPCTICDKSFGRQDALNRHLRAHAGQPGPSEYHRKRKRPNDNTTSMRRSDDSEESSGVLSGNSSPATTMTRQHQPQHQNDTVGNQQYSPVTIGSEGAVNNVFSNSGYSSSTTEQSQHSTAPSPFVPFGPQAPFVAHTTTTWPSTASGSNSNTNLPTNFDFANLNDVDILQLLSTSTLPFSSSIQASPNFYQSLGIDLAGSVHSSLAASNTLSSQQGYVDWAALAGISNDLTQMVGSGGSNAPNPTTSSTFHHSGTTTGQQQQPGSTHYRFESMPQQPTTIPLQDNTRFAPDAGVGQRAISQTHALVANASSNVISQLNMVSSHFLERCLSAFFHRFQKAFPIVHAPSFNIRTTSAPLLLSMIAVGSLCLQSDDARRLGDNIWRLAYTAVNSSWQELIKQKGAHDGCAGVALVMTLLLVQVYATASTDPELKNAAIVCQPLGFRWSRLAGMFLQPNSSELDQPTNIKSLKGDALVQVWNQWSAREAQRRTLNGLYVMDAQVCSLFDAAPSVRHISNPLPSTSTDAAFWAPTAEAWQAVMVQEEELLDATYNGSLAALFSTSLQGSGFRQGRISGFSAAVIVESIYCLVIEQRDLPISLRAAEWFNLMLRLDQFRVAFSGMDSDPDHDILSHSMRWHMTSICLLELWLPSGSSTKESLANIHNWFNTPQGRRAVLHANAIRQIIDDMPFSSISAPRLHSPVCAHLAGQILMLWLRYQSSKLGEGMSSSVDGTTKEGTSDWDLQISVDWAAIEAVGYVAFKSGTSTQGLSAVNFLLDGGKVVLDGQEVDTTVLSSLISALTTYGGTWPAARTMTNQLIAMTYS